MHAVDESSVSRTPLTADWPARTRVSWLAPGFTFPTENDFPDVPGNRKLPVFCFFSDFPIGKRFEIQISVFDIFRPDFGVFRPENVVGDRKL